MKHEMFLAVEHIKRLIAADQSFNITEVARFFGVHRVALSRALKREGVGQ